MTNNLPLVEAIKCDFCNDEPAEKQCDYCGANFCIDCEPNRDDDAPVDCCENCIEPPRKEST